MEYAFETITPEQALNIRRGDTLTINGAPGRAVTVTYQFYDPTEPATEVPSILVTVGDRAVLFGAGLTQVSAAGGVVMADGSKLLVGDTVGERASGTDFDDGLYGALGSDQLSGLGGADLIHGGAGDDTLTGGQGHDSIYGGQGDDEISLGDGEPGSSDPAGGFAHGNLGDDQVRGGAGDDWIYGGQGADTISAGDGRDYVSGDLGDDRLEGGLGDDTLVGGGGNDTLDGGFGGDLLRGGAGDDRLLVQGPDAGNLQGDDGNDTLTAASAGVDVLFGGAGRDRFEIFAKTAPSAGTNDLILDWESSDTLSFIEVGIHSILPREYSEFVADSYSQALAIANEHISGAGAKWVAAQVGGDVFVFYDAGDPADGADAAVQLVGRSLADIDLSNLA